MFTQSLLILAIALCISMLILSYKKILATEVGNFFVGLGDDIIRESSISFPKNRLEVPEFIKQIVAENRYEYSYPVTVVSNNRYAGSVRARSPTQFNEISLSKC